MTFYAGDKIKLTALFEDPDDGTDIDPTTVVVRWQQPDGTRVERTYGSGGSPAVAQDSTGNYSIEIDTTGKPGTWKYLWYSTGTGQAAEQGEFDVLPVIAAP